MRNFAKKLVTIALGSMMALATCAGVTACSNERGPNDILLWAGGQWTGSDKKNLENFIDWYNKNNEIDLNIILRVQTNFEKKFISASMNNKGPDLMIWDRFNTPSYADSEVLVSVDDYIAEYEAQTGVKMADAFNATAYKEMSYGGHQYGLPLDLDLWGIYVNMNLVYEYNKANTSNPITCFWDFGDSNPTVVTKIEDEAGLTKKLDWTWDEALDAAQKLKTLPGVKSGYDGEDVNEFFIHNYFSTGEPYIVNNKTVIDEVKGADTLTYLWNLYYTGESGYSGDNAFLGNTLAMYMRPTYFTSYLSNYASSMNVRFMPQPAYSKNGVKLGDNSGVMGGYGMAIPRPVKEKYRTEKWEAKNARCWDFMKDWLYNEEVMLQWAKISQTIPALLSTHDKEAVKGNKLLGDLVSGERNYTDVYVSRPSVPGWTSVQVNVFNDRIPTFCASQYSETAVKNLIATLEKQTDVTLESYGGLG